MVVKLGRDTEWITIFCALRLEAQHHLKLAYMKNGCLLNYTNTSHEYRKAYGQESKQSFSNGEQQKRIMWQL